VPVECLKVVVFIGQEWLSFAIQFVNECTLRA
jgi:hypothetical protein